VKVGLIARADDRGLGIMCWEFHRAMRPHATLVVREPGAEARGFQPHLDRYPDATVVCGKLSLDEEDPNAVTNPSVITEVLSVSTEGYDRGEKWSHYQLLASLREYVLVSSERVRVEVFRRVSGGEWTYSTHGPGEVVILPSLGVQLPVDALYEGWEELRAAEGGLPQQRPAL